MDDAIYTVWDEILVGRRKAHAKHGANSIEYVAADDYARWLPILIEEIGEAASTLTYDKSTSELRAELINVLCVASAWVNAIDRVARREHLARVMK